MTEVLQSWNLATRQRQTNCVYRFCKVILQQANNTDNIYYCVLEMRAIFTITADETSAVAPSSCLPLTVNDSHRAGSGLLAQIKYTIMEKHRYMYYSMIILFHSILYWERHGLNNKIILTHGSVCILSFFNWSELYESGNRLRLTWKRKLLSLNSSEEINICILIHFISLLRPFPFPSGGRTKLVKFDLLMCSFIFIL